MTGYGRGESAQDGIKFSAELNSVNRKQSDVVVTLPRELTELEMRVREVVNAEVSRGRLNVVITWQRATSTVQKPMLDTELARIYFRSILALQKELGATGEVNIETILRVPGVVHLPEEKLAPEEIWPQVEAALKEALRDLIRMREREGKHLAKDLIKRFESRAELDAKDPAAPSGHQQTLSTDAPRPDPACRLGDFSR
jgi:uncharacterized protein (TIGR00255 family)